MLGSWSGASDLWDPFEFPAGMTGDDGYVGVYHKNGVDGWLGETGFYRLDARSVLQPGETKTWAPIYLWADRTYSGDLMYLSLEPLTASPPPADWTYTLEVIAVPEEVQNGPGVGKTWVVSPTEAFQVAVPTFISTNGLEGYQFAFHVTAAVPEPASLLGLLVLAGLRRR